MRIRRATEADAAVLRELFEEFVAEVPEPPHREVSLDEELAELAKYFSGALALIVEENSRPVGYALAKLEQPRICFLSDLYVRRDARRQSGARRPRRCGRGCRGVQAAWKVMVDGRRLKVDGGKAVL